MMMTENPKNGIEREKYMDKNELKTLKTVVEAWHITDLRAGKRQGVVSWMLCDLALSTGLRVGELAALDIGDIDFQRAALRVNRLKRKKMVRETLAVDDELIQHLREFIEWKTLADEPIGKDDPLFHSKPRGTNRSQDPQRMGRQGLQKIWKRCIARAGLPENLSIHCARHTVATMLLRETGNLRQVQKQLGHSSPVVTANMYADVTFEDMQAGMAAVKKALR